MARRRLPRSCCGQIRSACSGMKVGEVLKRLRADGWTVTRMKGSHRQLTHATKLGTVTVAGHASMDLHPKTLASISRQSGVKLP